MGSAGEDQPQVHGILLLGGSGSRMRPYFSGNKHLIPIGGRPMAQHALELLTLCGIRTLSAVTGPDDVDQFRRLFDRFEPDLEITYIAQPHPMGTADALQRCANTVELPYVATLWGDNLFEVAPVATVRRFVATPVPCMITVAESVTPQHFSTVVIEGGRVTAISDKPAHPTTSTVCAGLMVFDTAALFRSVAEVGQNARGEREAMDAVRAFMRAGELSFDRLAGRWFDAAVSPASLREAELFALRRGFNHSMFEDQEPPSWTLPTRPHRSGSTSTPRGVAS
ncbi:sugar phosphate nucleotidyltransferase [Nocardia brasiliensis]|uniref:sugar phosphate nucleotidyltransferase n=1 Tax=Nocardia brasiliensis TaxID=37326 RepID=UPI002453D50F|nr:sugar phosphate nucleotidyltransferase [Nocardia brasiliensis]